MPKQQYTHISQEEQFNILFESNPFPMWIYDLKTLKFLLVNDAAVNIYGYSKQEFYKLSLKDIRPKEDEQRLLKNIENETSQYQWSSGWRHLTKSGSLLDVEIISHDIIYKGRNSRFVTVNDITEKKRTSENFQLVLESSPIAILLVNKEGKITYSNKQTETLFQYLPGELIGKSLEILIPEKYSKSHQKHHKDFFLNPKPRIIGKRTDLYGLSKNGNEIALEIGLNPINSEGGFSVLVTMQDITERIRSQEELSKAEKRYRTTLDYMMEGFQIISNDFRYLYINNAAAAQGRKTKDELIGNTMMEIYPGIEKSEMFAKLESCLKNHLHLTMENEFIYENGDREWFLLNMEPIPEGILILSKDITREKQTEDELKSYRENLEELVIKRTSQLDEANKELESFSYSVSHDLRAPLRHITGFVQILQKNISSLLDDKNQKYFSYIIESTKRMGMLIDDLLSFSRMAQSEMNLSKLNLNNIIKETILDLKDEINERNITWKISNMPEVLGDPSMLKQAYLNLISNAVKYTSHIDEPVIEIGVEAKQNEYIFSIKDNGAGFDPKYIDKLFGVFQRLHSSAEFEGTGIGLANVKRIINRHGGRVWANGQVNQGATFYFTLNMMRENHE